MYNNVRLTNFNGRHTILLANRHIRHISCKVRLGFNQIIRTSLNFI